MQGCHAGVKYDARNWHSLTFAICTEWLNEAIAIASMGLLKI